jgi:hypothetical protein
MAAVHQEQATQELIADDAATAATMAAGEEAGKAGKTGAPKRKRGTWMSNQRSGYTNLGRGDFRKQGGTAVSGPVGQEQRTCLPDALYVCLKHQGSGATLAEARSCMPDEGDTSIGDIKPFALEHGFKIESAGNDFSCNPRKTLSLLSGHHIVLLTLTDADNDRHEHACALTDVGGTMYIVDNMARRDLMAIGPEDRESQKDALKVFKNLFPGATRLSVRTVYSVVDANAANKRARTKAPETVCEYSD